MHQRAHNLVLSPLRHPSISYRRYLSQLALDSKRRSRYGRPHTPPQLEVPGHTLLTPLFVESPSGALAKLVSIPSQEPLPELIRRCKKSLNSSTPYSNRHKFNPASYTNKSVQRAYRARILATDSVVNTIRSLGGSNHIHSYCATSHARKQTRTFLTISNAYKQAKKQHARPTTSPTTAYGLSKVLSAIHMSVPEQSFLQPLRQGLYLKFRALVSREAYLYIVRREFRPTLGDRVDVMVPTDFFPYIVLLDRSQRTAISEENRELKRQLRLYFRALSRSTPPLPSQSPSSPPRSSPRLLDPLPSPPQKPDRITSLLMGLKSYLRNTTPPPSKSLTPPTSTPLSLRLWKQIGSLASSSGSPKDSSVRSTKGNSPSHSTGTLREPSVDNTLDNVPGLLLQQRRDLMKGKPGLFWTTFSLDPSYAKDLNNATLHHKAKDHDAAKSPTPKHLTSSMVKFGSGNGIALAVPRRQSALESFYVVEQGRLRPETTLVSPIPRTAEDPPIARLAHGLDRVLFNPFPTVLQNLHTGVYNYTPYLQHAPSVDAFDPQRVAPFIPSSQHISLQDKARALGRQFAGSTSSLTGMLSHCYFLLSMGKQVDTGHLSQTFIGHPRSFTPAARMPVAVKMHYRDGVYMFDSDSSDLPPQIPILMSLGVVLENFLTLEPAEFYKLLKSTELPSPPPEIPPESYQYTLTDNMVMRSQLDCWHPNLPGSGVFDIKTRATAAIRLDLANYEENSGYMLRTMTGATESYEREHYDMIRSAFLKYTLQARIGGMDGIFVAYHSVKHIHGFQYFPLEEMERPVYGSPNAGESVYRMTVGLLNRIAAAVAKIHPKESMKVTFDTNASCTTLRIWVEPLKWDSPEDPPVTELRVNATNMFGGSPVLEGFPSFDQPNWSLDFEIRRYAPSPLTRAALHQARMRRAQIGQVVLGLKEGDRDLAPHSGVEPSSGWDTSDALSPNIRLDYGFVGKLRALARQGHVDRVKLEEQNSILRMWDGHVVKPPPLDHTKSTPSDSNFSTTDNTITEVL